MNVGSIAGGFSPSLHVARPGKAIENENRRPPEIIDTPRAKPEKGVVGLLQESHFKGVADVRLRINFNEQLSPTDIRSFSQNFAGAKQIFSADLQSSLEVIQGSLAPREEHAEKVAQLGNVLSASADQLLADFQLDESNDIKVLGASLQSDADHFTASLQSLLGVDASDATILLFTQTFGSILSNLTSTLSDTIQKPFELTAPTGSGAAYAKFLEVLNGLPTSDVETESVLSDVYA